MDLNLAILGGTLVLLAGVAAVRVSARAGLPSQAPLLPWLARRTGVALEGRTRELEVESAPLDEMDASLLQVEVPKGSRMVGVYVTDLRLPANAALALIHRRGQIFVPDDHTSLYAGDHLLLAVSDDVRAEVEHRLRAIGESGRLAL